MSLVRRTWLSAALGIAGAISFVGCLGGGTASTGGEETGVTGAGAATSRGTAAAELAPSGAGAASAGVGASASVGAAPSASVGAAPSAGVGAAPSAPAGAEGAPLRLAFVGDMAFNYSIAKTLEAVAAGTAGSEVEAGFPLAGVKERLAGADLAMGNLECVVSQKGAVATWHKPFRAPAASVGAMLGAGIDVVTVANNHSWDFGGEAFFDMLKTLDERAVGVAGRGFRQELPHEAEVGVVREVRGTKVALLGFYLADDRDIARDVAAAASRAAVVVAYFHWGKEKQSDVTPEQRRQAKVAVDAGADLVVGAHVHVLQPVEMYRGKVIAYGLGNFVFMGMNHEERFRRGAILEVAMAGERVEGFELVPTRVDDRGAPRLVVAESSYLPGGK